MLTNLVQRSTTVCGAVLLPPAAVGWASIERSPEISAHIVGNLPHIMLSIAQASHGQQPLLMVYFWAKQPLPQDKLQDLRVARAGPSIRQYPQTPHGQQLEQQGVCYMYWTVSAGYGSILVLSGSRCLTKSTMLRRLARKVMGKR